MCPQFDPDRFGAGREEHKQPFAYLGFGAGMHQCMGQQFAFVQVGEGCCWQCLYLLRSEFTVCECGFSYTVCFCVTVASVDKGIAGAMIPSGRRGRRYRFFVFSGP